MNAENLEIYCKNLECGDQEVYTNHHGEPVISRKYRRMNYMGVREVGLLKTLLMRGTTNYNYPRGKFHRYQCPVCGIQRVYFENGDALSEIKDE